jgi:NAD(P)H-quinone oxidoreductase subunit 5
MQEKFFIFDSLVQLIAILVGFIGFLVVKFSINYLKGDRNSKYFFTNIFLIIAAIILCFSANNIYLFLAFFYLSNILLVFLIIHKPNWNEAFNSGILAAKYLIFGFVCLCLAFYFLNSGFKSNSINNLIANAQNISQRNLNLGLIFLTLAALSQSAIFPFHKWLLSSLNSPTPVSAIMHAGLINGGGILLVKFSKIYLLAPNFLLAIFVLGISSALIGSAFKLLQGDVKKMLACSTLSQMGFMFAACGLGLFASAIAHLFYHGMFKAYLFLSSSGAAQEKRFDLKYPPKLASFILALLIGAFAAIIFASAADFNIFKLDTSLVLVFLSLIFSAQLAINFLEKISIKQFLIALLITSLCAEIYGATIFLIEDFLSDLDLFKPQKFNLIHFFACLAIFSFWASRLFLQGKKFNSKIAKYFYTKTLNASQPHASCVTASRNKYRL